MSLQWICETHTWTQHFKLEGIQRNTAVFPHEAFYIYGQFWNWKGKTLLEILSCYTVLYTFFIYFTFDVNLMPKLILTNVAS